MDEILVYLLKKRAHVNFFRLSTIELGRDLGMSQQNASRKIILLEKEGKIRREKSGILITKKGTDDMNSEYQVLKEIFERPVKIEFSGKVVDGLGEGKYYIKKYSEKICEKIGFKPYFGTLNLKLDEESMAKRRILQVLEPVIIDDFEEGGRRYGGLFLYSCKIGKLNGAIVIPMRTHHGNEILEIISDKKMRDKLKNKKVVVSIG